MEETMSETIARLEKKVASLEESVQNLLNLINDDDLKARALK